MKDLRTKADITNREKKDQQEVKGDTKKGDDVRSDTKHIDKADKAIDLKGTEEGAKGVLEHLNKALDAAKEVHKKIDDKLGNTFKQIETVEQNLGQRGSQMDKDMRTIQQEASAFKSADTKPSQSAMKEGMREAKQDSEFLKDAQKKEGDIRTKGQKEMSKQKSEVQSVRLKTRRG